MDGFLDLMQGGIVRNEFDWWKNWEYVNVFKSYIQQCVVHVTNAKLCGKLSISKQKVMSNNKKW